MKKIFITGARSGIINKVVDKIKNNYYLYLSVRNEKQLEYIKEKYRNYPNIECLKLDITNKNDRDKISLLDIDVLISNAAIGEGGSISEIDMNKVRNNFEVNVFSNFELIQVFLKKMVLKNQGKIIIISSLAAHLPLNFLGSYCATKASISMLARTLKNELKLINRNIKIKLIEPGLYHTGFNQVMLDNKYDWMDTDSYFEGIIKDIKENEHLYFGLLEKKEFNSIVSKIILAIKNDDNRFLYSAPFTQFISTKIYNLIK